MKLKKIIIVVLFLSYISCSKNEIEVPKNNLIGTWKLAEVLADPGDGSGIFNPVNSNKNLIFQTDGTLTSNGEICNMSIQSNTNSTGTFSVTNSTINAINCPNSNIKYVMNGNTLILTYFCIEPCKSKYIKQ